MEIQLFRIWGAKESESFPYPFVQVYCEDRLCQKCVKIEKNKWLRFKFVITSIVQIKQESTFPCLSSLSSRGELGEFGTVMETRNIVEDLHNFREFFQSP